jgi:predicted ATPase
VKLTKILLRWYKSFHLNYRGVSEKGETTAYRPWNRLSPKYASQDEFPFIEIPIEPDISTIVGGNESGKSHLLNAVTKVITGYGLSGKESFERTDLCHYAGVRTRNVEAWPNVGLQFTIETDDEHKQLNIITESTIASKSDAPRTFAIILAPDHDPDKPAHLFIEPNEQGIMLSTEQLMALRLVLPRVQFIDSHAELPGEIPLAKLLAAYGDKKLTDVSLPSRHAVEEAVGLMQSLTPLAAQQPVPVAFVQQFDEVRQKLANLGGTSSLADSLEMQLFREILGIKLETLRYIYNLTVDNRGYVEGQIAKWNDEIQDRLNLAHFWSQDEQFTLSVNYKDGIIYFEIRDKTDSIYTFNERSSGLRFFLSYYIQAKAMESSSRNRNAVILMDEPDSALSIVGQRNLLAVFESLVSPESSGQTCQLIYTTHSPYLINRNFPRRLRVVKKEDAEQGTQYIEQARARRYEPVRTALGIDSAPSLFLGSDNILTEGPTDQFLLTELVRVFATPQNVGEFVDLNAVEVVSADGAGNIENVLDQSHWADEPIPPTVIVVDGDKPGLDVIDKITRTRPIIERAFATTISERIAAFGDNVSIVTTEDIIPRQIYTAAVKSYIVRWLPNSLKERATEINAALTDLAFGKDGFVASTKALFRTIKPECEGDYDKMGVFQEVVAIAATRLAALAQADAKLEKPTTIDAELDQLKRNVILLCDFIREALAQSRAVTATRSATQAIKRIVHDFQRLNKANVPVTNVQKLIHRLEREVAPIGTDGEHIQRVLNEYSVELERLRAAGQSRIVDGQWGDWQQRIEKLKNNPLQLIARA